MKSALYLSFFLLTACQELPPFDIGTPNYMSPKTAYTYWLGLTNYYRGAFQYDFDTDCDTQSAMDGYVVHWVDAPYFTCDDIGINCNGIINPDNNYNGIIRFRYRDIYVADSKAEYLSLRTLGHEVGHALLYKCLGIHGEESLYEYTQRWGLPYMLGVRGEDLSSQVPISESPMPDLLQ